MGSKEGKRTRKEGEEGQGRYGPESGLRITRSYALPSNRAENERWEDEGIMDRSGGEEKGSRKNQPTSSTSHKFF